jgi:hypothetical protein
VKEAQKPEAYIEERLQIWKGGKNEWPDGIAE